MSSNRQVDTGFRYVEQPSKKISIRCDAKPYIVAATVFGFCGLWLFHQNIDVLALAFAFVAVLILPALSYFERIYFDGDCFTRRGPVAALGKLSGRKLVLTLSDAESVTTTTHRTFRRGDRVYYRYRTEVRGNNECVVLLSGWKRVNSLVLQVLSVLEDYKLDCASIELKRYYRDTNGLDRSLQDLNLASLGVLANAPYRTRTAARSAPRTLNRDLSIASREKGAALLLAANQLRLHGRLRESLEAFRRAAVSIDDPILFWGLGRLLHSISDTGKERSLKRRAIACFRLGARRAWSNEDLLLRIGESLVEVRGTAEAGRIFSRCLELQPASIRARFGLALTSLKDGKVAHALFSLREASSTESPHDPLSQLAMRESLYFHKLSTDDAYLEREATRLSWLQSLGFFRRSSLKLLVASLVVALTGPVFDPRLDELGWSLAFVSGGLWLAGHLIFPLLKERRCFEP